VGNLGNIRSDIQRMSSMCLTVSVCPPHPPRYSRVRRHVLQQRLAVGRGSMVQAHDAVSGACRRLCMPSVAAAFVAFN
jgi:hypothetical protein